MHTGGEWYDSWAELYHQVGDLKGHDCLYNLKAPLCTETSISTWPIEWVTPSLKLATHLFLTLDDTASVASLTEERPLTTSNTLTLKNA